MTNEEIQKRMVQHGEVLLVPVDALPGDLEQIHNGKEFIVGHSETGHHHVAVGDVTAFKPIGADSQEIYLRVNKESVIEHRKSFDRHETKTLHEGVYLVKPKTEYDPFLKIIEQVRD